jgi:hypothetical protein
MSESDLEYDLRQYKLMLSAIHDYQRGTVKLGRLISDLDALRDALQNPSQSWLGEFESAWGKLEDVYAGMLDEERTQFDETDRRLINEGVSKLTSLIESKIAKE